MDREKLYQSVGYLIEKHGGRLNYMKLIKLLYIADREMINQTGYPITGDSYCSMKNGPVLSRLYDLIRGKDFGPDQIAWNGLFRTTQYILTRSDDGVLELGDLTPREISILDCVSDKFQNHTQFDLCDYLHQRDLFPEVEWQESGRTSRALPIDSIRHALGFSDAEIAEIHADDELLEKENAVLRL